MTVLERRTSSFHHVGRQPVWLWERLLASNLLQRFSPRTLTFRDDSEVWLIPDRVELESNRNYYNNEPTHQRRLREEGGQQQYVGMLTSREQRQWIVTTPVRSMKPFEWTAGEGPASPRVKNLLPEAWLGALFVDGNSNTYLIEKVVANGETSLQSVPNADALLKLKEMMVEPAYPAGYSNLGATSLADWFSGTTVAVSSTTPALLDNTESIVTHWIQNELKQPNRFLILLELGQHVDRPFSKPIQETDSSHILLGTW